MTTKEVGMMLNLPSSDITYLCRTNQLYAEKRKPEGKNFPEWHISLESFARFLQYNYAIERVIFERQGEPDMKNVISAMLKKATTADKRTFTLGETETILGLTKMEIRKLCWSGKLGNRHLIVRNFTLFDILNYLKYDPRAEEDLRERYERALVNGHPTLMLLREIVTDYAYFKEYGYII